MAYNNLTRPIIILLSIIVAVAISVWCFNANYVICGVLGVIVVVILFMFTIRIYKLSAKKVAFMFDAIKNDDFTFRFITNAKSSVNDKLLNESLNRIKDLVLDARIAARERERYFETILEQVSTGIVVLNKDGIVFRTNKAALDLLQITRLTHINQLSLINENIPQQFMNIESGSSELIRFFDDASQITLSLTSTNVILQNKSLKIISIINIGKDIDTTEMDSWNRISRVLTHEIMNSLTPITSLSQTLLDTPDDPTTTQRGLEIINSTAQRLIGFVDNYRLLTRIPRPYFTEFDIVELLHNQIDIQHPNISINFNCPCETIIFADKDLISLVVQNLLKNGIEAIETSSHKDAKLWIELGNNSKGHLLVAFCNSGDMISDELSSNIFVPFFTTKNGGSGIGLSISRQIMRLHNGSISLSTHPTTRFTLTF